MKKANPHPLSEDRLEQELSILRGLPARDSQAARRGRERFLAEVKAVQAAKANPIRPWDRLAGIFIGKPKFAFSPLLAVLLAVALLLAGVGTTVYASQGSQPDEPFYPVKLWSEDVRLQFARDAQARLTLAEEFAGRRVAELIAMQNSGKTARPEVSDRLQSLVDDAIRSASSLPGETGQQALTNLADNLARHQDQLEKMSQNANPRAAAEFARVVAMLELKEELATQGEHNPAALQELMRQMQKETQKENGGSERSPAPGSAGTEKTVGPENGANGKANPEPGPQVTHTPRANGQGTPENPGKGKGDK